MGFATDDVVRIDDVVFWGGAGDEGFFIDEDGFEGWEDSPDVRSENIERLQAHGEFDAPAFFGARQLTVTGRCWTTSAERLGWYGNRLRGLLVGQKRVTVDYQGVTSFADGRQSAKTIFQTVLPGQMARFQFSLRFPDPRKYGDRTPLEVTPSGVSQPIYHRGNFVAAPQLVVRGSMPAGYTVEGPGSSFVVSRAVTAATPHVLDCATGLLSVNGVVQFGAVSSGSGWVIAPGSRPVTHRLVPVSGSGSLETVLRDTYI